LNAARRIALSLGCLACAGFAARASIGDAILARGDEAARADSLVAATRYYERAELVGGVTLAALERFALLALLSPEGALPASALRSANAYLAARPQDPAGHFDRGLIEWRERAYASAAADFRIAAVAGNDSRARTFAAASLRREERMARQ
jgi:hypothetical protein